MNKEETVKHKKLCLTTLVCAIYKSTTMKT